MLIHDLSLSCYPLQSLQTSLLQEGISHQQLRQSSGVLRAHPADQRALTALHTPTVPSVPSIVPIASQ